MTIFNINNISNMATSILSSPISTATLYSPISCSGCNKLSDPSIKFKVCSGCNVAHYCNVECQKDHWPSHKPFCKKRNNSRNKDVINVVQYLFNLPEVIKNIKFTASVMPEHCSVGVQLNKKEVDRLIKSDFTNFKLENVTPQYGGILRSEDVMCDTSMFTMVTFFYDTTHIDSFMINNGSIDDVITIRPESAADALQWINTNAKPFPKKDIPYLQKVLCKKCGQIYCCSKEGVPHLIAFG